MKPSIKAWEVGAMLAVGAFIAFAHEALSERSAFPAGTMTDTAASELRLQLPVRINEWQALPDDFGKLADAAVYEFTLSGVGRAPHSIRLGKAGCLLGVDMVRLLHVSAPELGASGICARVDRDKPELVDLFVSPEAARLRK